MNAELIAELLRIFQATEIISSHSFSFAGRLFAPLDPALSPWPTAPAQSPLVAQLAQQLYSHCYCRRFHGALVDEPYIAPAFDDSILAELSAANSGQDRWDAGWQTQRLLPSGQIIAQKGGRTRLLWPGEFVSQEGPGMAMREGARLSIYAPRESSQMRPGFYFVFSESVADQQDDYNLIRFYWHIAHDGAPLLVQLITREFNRFQLPFRFKSLASRISYRRSDAAVLYINKRFFRLSSELLAGILPELATHLGPDTPLFTKALAPGLGLAEEPGNGESFGQHRCRLLAESIWHAYEKNLQSDQDRLQFLRDHFQRNGLTLDLPFLNPGSIDQYRFPTRTIPNHKMNDRQKEFLETASYLGALVCRDALWADNRCNWLGPSMEYTGNAWTAVHKAYGPDLYSGTCGIAFFLGHLFAATQERIYRVVAEGAINHCLSRLDDLHPNMRSALYSGWTGIAYALCELGPILDRPDYLAAALRLTKVMAGDDPDQQGLDVISGSAGAIPALLHMRKALKQDFLLDLAIRHGDHLLATARKSEIGWSWDTLSTPRDLTGFSHGTAGIGIACLELFSETREERFHEAAQAAFRYERYWFNSEHENWPDFRSFGDTPAGVDSSAGYSLAWCHGAPGIGLSRLRAYELTGDEVYRTEAELAIRTTGKMLSSSAYTEQNNFSLCHGLTGNADLLIYANQITPDDGYVSLIYQIGEQGIARHRRNGMPWPCGVPGGGETPNLMLGLAGIGYYYLRLSDPKRNRSVLIVLPDDEGGRQTYERGQLRQTRSLT